MSRFRIYQAQTDALAEDDNWRISAGDFVIQRFDDKGQWRNYEGPYSKRQESEAQRRLNMLRKAELEAEYDRIAMQ
jgi:hypothetical protein